MEKPLVIDKRQEAYGTFFSDNFGHDAFAASDAAPMLAEPIFDLVGDWRSASYAGALPALIRIRSSSSTIASSALKLRRQGFSDTRT